MLKATVIGNIATDAEVKTLKNGKTSLSLSVAHDKGKNVPPVWVRVLWAQGVDAPVRQYLTKGAKVCVTGDLNVSLYTAKDGSAQAGIDLFADSVEVVMYPKREGAQAPQAAPARRPQAAPAYGSKAPAQQPAYGGGPAYPGYQAPDYGAQPGAQEDLPY